MYSALRIIAGEAQCLNNLLSDKEIAHRALAIVAQPPEYGVRRTSLQRGETA